VKVYIDYNPWDTGIQRHRLLAISAACSVSSGTLNLLELS